MPEWGQHFLFPEHGCEFRGKFIRQDVVQVRAQAAGFGVEMGSVT